MKKFNRDTKGRFASKKKHLIWTLIFAVLIGIPALHFAPEINGLIDGFGDNLIARAEYTQPQTVVQYVEVDNLGEKVAELKSELLAKLAACESGGTEEPDAAIILDTNKRMSIGRYMWQRRSVQHYVELFYGKEVSLKEATLIALGEGEIDLDELTEKVIFEDTKNLENWHNCSTKEGLYAERELIIKLES